MASRSNRPDFNRRKMLGLIGMSGAAGIAGCIGDDGDDGNGDTPTPTSTPGDDPTPTPTEPIPDDAQQIIYDLMDSDAGQTVTFETAADAVADGVYGMRFTFNLQEGVQFHDGTELTSDDVIASYERYKHSDNDDQTFDDIMYVEADGDYTVNVYLALPDPEGIRNAVVTIMPESVATVPDAEADPRAGNDPMGTGPYVFEEFEDTQYFVQSKNENYWVEEKGLDEAFEWWDGPEDFPASPLFDEIDMELIPDDSNRQAALLNDEVDFTYGLSTDDLDEFVASEDYHVVSTEAGGYDFLQWPMHHEPWGSTDVRNAANFLIPRELIATSIFNEWRSPAWTPLPTLAHGSGTADHDALEDELRPKNEYDPEEAASLLDAQDIDYPIELTLETNADATDRVSTNELIAATLSDTDYFDVSLELTEWGDFTDVLYSETYFEEGRAFYVGLSGTFNPGSFCEATHHPVAHGGCCNANNIYFDDLTPMMDEASSELDPQTRAETYDDIWRFITDEDGTVYINISLNSAVMHNRVQGYEAYPFNENIVSYGLWSPTGEVYTEFSDSEEDTFRVAAAENIDSFDPPYSGDTTSSMGQSLIYEGLTTNTPDGEVLPWLATGWEVDENPDITVDDYEDYMIPIEEAQGGN